MFGHWRSTLEGMRSPGPLVVVERKLPRAVGERRVSPAGLDVEYTLSLKLKP